MIHPGTKNTPPKVNSRLPNKSEFTNDTLQSINEYFITLLKSQCNVLSQYPITCYISLLQSYPRLKAHKYVGQRVLQLSKKIENTYSADILETYHKLVMATLIEKQEQLNFPFQLTPSLKTQYERKVADILTGLIKHVKNQGCYVYDHEHFIYNLGICKKTTIPVGPFRLNLNRMKFRFITGATRRLGLKWYANEGKHLKRICLHRLPFIEIHLDMYDKEMGSFFNPRGWEQLFYEIEEIMKLNPELRYFVSMSWFFDPHLETISPELTYIRELVQTRGGHLIRFLPGETAAKNATRFSATRTRLMKEGTYTPTNYLMVVDKYVLKKCTEKH
jgi:hypothetical protein